MSNIDYDELRKLARTSISAYASVMHHQWQPNWHHRVIAKALERFAANEPGWNRLILSMPPRSGKTELVSKLFPGWFMANNPHENVIVATYGSELADDLGRKAREYVSDELFESIMGVTISKDTNAITKWELSNKAAFFSTSVGGALTGKGANCLLIDDPVKNREEAESEGAMQKIWDWFTSTAYTRLEQNGRVLIVMTRWSEIDLAGRLLASNAKKSSPGSAKWREIVFPAIAEVDDGFRRVGEALWPTKYSLETLIEIKETIGFRDWASLYQQRPSPAEGNIFRGEWFHLYDGVDWLLNASGLVVSGIYQSWDTAVSNKKTSARSACTTWAVIVNNSSSLEPRTSSFRGDNFYLLDTFAETLEFPELRKKARALAERWQPDVIYVEEQQTGRPLIDELKRTIGYKMVPVRPRGDKVSRAKAASVAFETGRVFLPRGAAWLDAYTSELMTFPAGPFADRVDSTSMALTTLMRGTHQRGYRGDPRGDEFSILQPISSIFHR